MEIILISRSVYKNVLFLSQAPGAPSRVVFSEVTGSSVNVSWGVPLQPNGVVEGYRVVYEPTAPVHGEQDGEKTTLLSLYIIIIQIEYFSFEYRYIYIYYI